MREKTEKVSTLAVSMLMYNKRMFLILLISLAVTALETGKTNTFRFDF